MEHPRSTPRSSARRHRFAIRSLAVSLVFLLIFGGLGFWLLKHEAATDMLLAKRSLEGVCELKASQIADWYHEHTEDADQLFEVPLIRWRVQRLLAKPPDPGARVEVLKWMKAFAHHEKYDRVVLFDADLVAQCAVPTNSMPLSPEARHLASAALKGKKVVSSDLYRDTATGETFLDLWVPLYGAPTNTVRGLAAEPDSPLAIVLCRLDPKTFLYPLLHFRPASTITAETLLVRRDAEDVVVLNDPRDRTNGALELRLPPGMIKEAAAKGESTFVEEMDYRNVPVFAAVAPVNGSPWTLVEKKDRKEIFAPLRARAAMFGVVAMLASLSCGLALSLVVQRRENQSLSGELALSERLKALTQQANDAILVFDESWRILEANDRAVDLFGYAQQELLSLTLRDLRTDPSPPTLSWDLGSDSGQASLRKETRHRRKDGSEVPVELSARIITVGTERYCQAIIRDISERVARDNEIRRLTRLYALSSHVNKTVVRASAQTPLFADICAIAVEHGGFSRAWIAGFDSSRSTLELLASGGGARSELEAALHGFAIADGPVAAALAQGTVWVSNLAIEDDALATWRPFLANAGVRACAILPLARGGTVIGCIGLFASEQDFFQKEEVRLVEEVAYDVSFALDQLERAAERERAEHDIIRARDYYLTLLEDFPALVWRAGADGKRDYFNRTWLGFTGRKTNQEVGSGWAEGVHEDDLERVVRDYLSAFQAHKPFEIEYRLRRGDGTYRWMTDAGRPFFNLEGGFAGYIGTCMDVTAHKESEARLREQAQLLDLAHDAIVVCDLAGRVRFWNRGAQSLYGWTAEEAMQGDGVCWIRSSSEPFESARNAVLEKQEWSGHLSRQTKAGDELVVDSRWTLLTDQNGRPHSLLTIDTDITEKKKLEARFLRAQRLESLGVLAGGIAHDLNNILAPIILSADLLRTERGPESVARLAQSIVHSAHRGADVVKRVLTFARGLEGERIPVDPRALIEDLCKMIAEAFPKSITVKADVNGELWAVVGDATQLHQVLLNLAVNARDAMPNGGTLTVRVSNAELDDLRASQIPGAHPGQFVVIEVRDTGTGIPPAIADRIFDPFFTTKELGKGTGLGLSTTLGIVRSHNGFLTVESKIDEGSKFAVYLPALVDTDVRGNAGGLAAPPTGQGELILVVEDEAALREIMRKTLVWHGYRVLVASDGAAAIPIYADRHSEIRLVITDIMMPNLDGLTLVRVLQRINSRVRLLAATGMAEGMADAERLAQLKACGVAEVLSKPFSTEKLLQAVHAEVSRP